MPARGRSLIRQGFILLFLALLMGFGVAAGGPSARSWMGGHITALMSGMLAILIGLCWDRLVLSPGQRSVLFWSVVIFGYLGEVAAVYAAALGIPGPATGGGAKPEGPAGMFFLFGFIPILTVLPLTFCGLMLYGLRGDGRSAGDQP
jgi:hypothetical protein